MPAILYFKAKIEILGINPYVLVNAKRAGDLQKDWRKPMPVLVRINNKPDKKWHINMMPKGDGSFYLYLHESVRTASETKVGDTVNVELSFDSAYKNGPMHEMPAELTKALNKNNKAKKYWENLTLSRQKEVLRYYCGLKSEEAKIRNLEKIFYVLSGNKAHFMGRDWNNKK